MWSQIGIITISFQWQYTSDIPTGSLFRLRLLSENSAIARGLIAQSEAVGSELYQIRSLYPHKQGEVIKFEIPECFSTRVIAVKALYSPAYPWEWKVGIDVWSS